MAQGAKQTGKKIKPDNADLNDANSKLSDYFRCSINKAAIPGAPRRLVYALQEALKKETLE